MNSLYEWRGDELDAKIATIDELELQIKGLEAKVEEQTTELIDYIDLVTETNALLEESDKQLCSTTDELHSVKANNIAMQVDLEIKQETIAAAGCTIAKLDAHVDKLHEQIEREIPLCE